MNPHTPQVNRKSDVNYSDDPSEAPDSPKEELLNQNQKDIPDADRQQSENYQLSDHTHYHEFLHPNLHKKADAISHFENTEQPRLIQWFERMDQ